MSGNTKIYWALIILALAAITASFIVRNSPVQSTRALANPLGWGAIVLIVIARFGFRPRRNPPPPPARD